MRRYSTNVHNNLNFKIPKNKNNDNKKSTITT